MSSSICLSMQQACFEPLLMQPRVFGLALFQNVQPSVSVDHVACREEGIYVHPHIRRSDSALSRKSLEMCTESLGSETGSCDFQGDEGEAETYPLFLTNQCRQFPEVRSRKSDVSRPHDFPPPLKSMTGSTVIRMRPYRSNGRLILQSVSVSYCRTSFLIERSEGRLRLSLFQEEEVTGYKGHGEPVGEARDEADEEEEQQSDEAGIGIEEERIGGGRRQRPCRCKEGKDMLNLKPCWVAT